MHFAIQNNAGQTIDELVTAINGNRIVATGMGDANLVHRSSPRCARLPPP